MYVTVLPVASKTYFCSPKANNTSPLLITKRVLQLISGFGLSINGKHTYCGDYIYSGHTVVLVLSYLIIKECTYFRQDNKIGLLHKFWPAIPTEYKFRSSWLLGDTKLSYC